MDLSKSNINMDDLRRPTSLIDKSSPLRAIAIKTERAIKTVEEIHRLETEFWAGVVPKFEESEDASNGELLIHVVDRDALIPEEIPIFCGEVLYQIRSGYDQLMNRIAEFEGLATNRRRYFPVGDTEQEFLFRLEDSCGDFPTRWKDAISETNVYYGKNDLVREIFRLNNKDKHADVQASMGAGAFDYLKVGYLSSPKQIHLKSEGCITQGILVYRLYPGGRHEITAETDFLLKCKLVIEGSQLTPHVSLVETLEWGAVAALSNFLVKSDQMRQGYI